jgi:hypothetical protein
VLVIQNSFSAKKEIEMYKVGDKVLMEVEIVSVDKDDEWLTYEIEFDDETYWVSPKDIYSALPIYEVEKEEAAEEASELKYKIGDKVKHKFKPEWGIGTITFIDTSIVDCDYVDDSYDVEYDLPLPYLVRYPKFKNKSKDDSYPDVWYTKESNLELVTEEKQNDQG